MYVYEKLQKDPRPNLIWPEFGISVTEVLSTFIECMEKDFPN